SHRLRREPLCRLCHAHLPRAWRWGCRLAQIRMIRASARWAAACSARARDLPLGVLPRRPRCGDGRADRRSTGCGGRCGNDSLVRVLRTGTADTAPAELATTGTAPTEPATTDLAITGTAPTDPNTTDPT